MYLEVVGELDPTIEPRAAAARERSSSPARPRRSLRTRAACSTRARSASSSAPRRAFDRARGVELLCDRVLPLVRAPD